MHDLLLSKSGIAAPASHPLRAAVTKHKARLSAELTKIRVRKGFRGLDELRLHLTHNAEPQFDDGLSEVTALSESKRHWPHPRWVRINTLKTTLADQLGTTFAEHTKAGSLNEVLLAKPDSKILCEDDHIPNLIALPPGADLIKLAAYRNGMIILQDKASCFPACLLDPQAEDGDFVDACAAPGNKTTHLAALLQRRCQDVPKARIWACERDKARSDILTQMVNLAGCQNTVTIKAGHDFLRLDPEKAPWKDVGSLLLDPSCSGSGIVGRDETLAVTLPDPGTNLKIPMKGRKRKCGGKIDVNADTSNDTRKEREQEPGHTNDTSLHFPARLKALSAFQLQLLLHAFRFPSAKRISYSTCSIYAEENEHVIITALQLPVAKQHHWRLLRRDEQVAGMQSWSVRGDAGACHQGIEDTPMAEDEIAEACIRCRAGTAEGTQGFFVAAFVRDHLGHENHQESLSSSVSVKGPGSQGFEQEDDEWDGFSDSS